MEFAKRFRWLAVKETVKSVEDALDVMNLKENSRQSMASYMYFTANNNWESVAVHSVSSYFQKMNVLSVTRLPTATLPTQTMQVSGVMTALDWRNFELMHH